MTTTRKPRTRKSLPLLEPVPPPAPLDPWDRELDPRGFPLKMGDQAFVEALDQAADLLKESHGDPGIGTIVQCAANELRRLFYEQRLELEALKARQ